MVRAWSFRDALGLEFSCQGMHLGMGAGLGFVVRAWNFKVGVSKQLRNMSFQQICFFVRS